MTPAHEARIRAAFAALADAVVDAVGDESSGAPAPERLLSIDEAAAALGIGRTLAYDEVAAGRLRSLKVGRRRVVPSSAIAERIGQ